MERSFCLFAFGKNWEEMAILLKGLNWLDISELLSQLGCSQTRQRNRQSRRCFLDRACIPAMIATDITSGEKVVLKSGNVAAAVMASSCIPGIFIPVEIDNRLLVDGELVENVPISPLKDMGATFIISVDLFGKLKQKKPENIIEVLFKSFHIALKPLQNFRQRKAIFLSGQTFPLSTLSI